MEWLARAIGAFYVFAGLVALNAARMELFLDRALDALGDAPPPATDRLRVSMLATVSVLTLVGGLLLLWPSRWAVPAFLLNCAVQGAYLAWARNAVPAQSLDHPLGRRRTINVFIIYLFATAIVLGMLAAGVLR